MRDASYNNTIVIKNYKRVVYNLSEMQSMIIFRVSEIMKDAICNNTPVVINYKRLVYNLSETQSIIIL